MIDVVLAIAAVMCALALVAIFIGVNYLIVRSAGYLLMRVRASERVRNSEFWSFIFCVY